jgi:ABC-2 type transport system permease protein
VSKIARNEFIRVLDNPIIIVIGIILLAIGYINAAGDFNTLINIATFLQCDGLLYGYGQVFYYTNFICGIMAAFLGVMAISGDRFTGSFNVLLAKPVYRRDFIIGKYIGLTGFIVLFLMLEMIVYFLMLLFFYGEPLSLSEIIVRVSAYIFVLTLDLVLVMGLAMLIGIMCKNILTASSLVVTYLSFEWFWNQSTSMISMIINFPLSPYMLTGRILFGSGIENDNLFNSTVQFNIWLFSALPEIIIMALIALAVLLINCHIFTRSDNI